MLIYKKICFLLFQNVDREKRKAWYSLYAVVEHSGRINSGHYVCYVKLRKGLSADEVLKFVGDSILKKFEKNSAAGAVAANLGENLDLNENLPNFGAAGGQNNNERKSNENVMADDPNGGADWYYVSDNFVSKSDVTRVLKSSAYLLFYERIL